MTLGRPPGGAQRTPKSPPETSRRPQEGPKGGPRAARDSPREARREVQDASCERGRVRRRNRPECGPTSKLPGAPKQAPRYGVSTIFEKKRACPSKTHLGPHLGSPNGPKLSPSWAQVRPGSLQRVLLGAWRACKGVPDHLRRPKQVKHEGLEGSGGRIRGSDSPPSKQYTGRFRP